ncbi:MAG: hypothetical protein ACXAE3_10535 [Candidatus Kariarchaeaceae archaeon]|jgi:hypothetical protein
MNSWDSDSPENNIYDEIDDFFENEEEDSYFIDASESLRDLLSYPFGSRVLDGKVDPTYNDVERVDVVKDKLNRSVRCPVKFMEVVRFIEEIRGRKPSIGLRYKDGAVSNVIHFLFEDTQEGWIYLDSKRSLQVRQIHKIEKILDHVGLKKIGIIADQIGLAARHEVSRINSERGKIMDLRYYDTIHNHSLSEYF